ncbi:MAG: ubiquinone/menaquinone biosynthesis methyltransferase [Gracilibacteraceae bacterium]|jgi:demethylmenaquinone methyltransferase/2-methoxy-6-polyprenyl-1,4-benzoquinol methylase|nr:ubiquinone/menaquinone biosynthesis methyltransferase [Gracilibacteraceae bacterium]
MNEEGGGKSRMVRDIFGEIAEKYDFMNSVMSLGLDRHWRRQAVRTARIRTGHRVADICCGTGRLTLAARAAAGREGEVVGLDFSPAMLCVAAGNVEAECRRTGSHVGSISFVQGDAAELPFATASFDAVLIGWGLRNITDREGAVREMRRIVKPGGRVVSLDMGQPRFPGMSAVYWPVFARLIPFLGSRCAGGKAREYAYLYESARCFPPQEELADMFRRCGLTATGALDLAGGAVALVYGEKSPLYPGE